MNTNERDEFDVQLRLLCAGNSQVWTQERSDAYWAGLRDMGLTMFGRIVEYCLGPLYESKDRMPTTGQIWRVYRQLKANAVVPVTLQPLPVTEQSEAERMAQLWRNQANHRLMSHIAECSKHNPRRYGSVARRDRMVNDGCGTDAELAVFRARIAPLLRVKDLWAMDMIESRESERTPDYMRSTWNDLIANAEREVDAMLKAAEVRP